MRGEHVDYTHIGGVCNFTPCHIGRKKFFGGPQSFLSTPHDPVLRGLNELPPGGLQNVYSNPNADQATGGPAHTTVSPGQLQDLCETENGSRWARYVHPSTVGYNPMVVWREVATLVLTMALYLPTYNTKHNGGVEPCSPPTNNTKVTPHENSTDDRKITYGGAERCSPPENCPLTTVWSPAPRPWQHFGLHNSLHKT